MPTESVPIVDTVFLLYRASPSAFQGMLICVASAALLPTLPPQSSSLSSAPYLFLALSLSHLVSGTPCQRCSPRAPRNSGRATGRCGCRPASSRGTRCAAAQGRPGRNAGTGGVCFCNRQPAQWEGLTILRCTWCIIVLLQELALVLSCRTRFVKSMRALSRGRTVVSAQDSCGVVCECPLSFSCCEECEVSVGGLGDPAISAQVLRLLKCPAELSHGSYFTSTQHLGQ